EKKKLSPIKKLQKEMMKTNYSVPTTRLQQESKTKILPPSSLSSLSSTTKNFRNNSNSNTFSSAIKSISLQSRKSDLNYRLSSNMSRPNVIVNTKIPKSQTLPPAASMLKNQKIVSSSSSPSPFDVASMPRNQRTVSSSSTSSSLPISSMLRNQRIVSSLSSSSSSSPSSSSPSF